MSVSSSSSAAMSSRRSPSRISSAGRHGGLVGRRPAPGRRREVPAGERPARRRPPAPRSAPARPGCGRAPPAPAGGAVGAGGSRAGGADPLTPAPPGRPPAARRRPGCRGRPREPPSRAAPARLDGGQALVPELDRHARCGRAGGRRTRPRRGPARPARRTGARLAHHDALGASCRDHARPAPGGRPGESTRAMAGSGRAIVPVGSLTATPVRAAPWSSARTFTRPRSPA